MTIRVSFCSIVTQCRDDVIRMLCHRGKYQVIAYLLIFLFPKTTFQLIKLGNCEIGFMNSSMYSSNQIGDYNGTNFCMDLTPPPPPPLGQIMNCGELREHHHGAFVEMDGKVNRTRMGRFIELKDQYGVTQLVAPIDVSSTILNILTNLLKHFCL